MFPGIYPAFHSVSVWKGGCLICISESGFPFVLILAWMLNGILEVTFLWVFARVWVRRHGVSSWRFPRSTTPAFSSSQRGRPLPVAPSCGWWLVNLADVGSHCKISSLEPFGAHEPCVSGSTHCCFLHCPWDFSSHDALHLFLSSHLWASCPSLLHFLLIPLFFPPLKTISFPGVAFSCLKVNRFLKILFYTPKYTLSPM